MKMPKVLENQNGFTLIELLVAIAVIGLLSSILLVSLNESRKKASLTAVANNARTIQTQVDLSRDLNNNFVKAITGACPGCGTLPGVKLINQPVWVRDSNIAGWMALGFAAEPRDGWGGPYMIFPKESETECEKFDQVYSAGPDGILTSYGWYSGAGPGELSAGSDDDLIFSLTHFRCP
jgi:prepilin-type N-terminal cleavage/methylation domain-containing protein